MSDEESESSVPPDNPPSTTATVIIDGKEFSTACISYLQSILSPDELPAAIVHCSTSAENDAQDSWGLQGGQGYRDTQPPVSSSPTAAVPTATPTKSTPGPSTPPTASPTLSLAPTGGEPTYHPTLHDRLFVLRGTIYYDRNANGSRDANLKTDEYGADTEYEIGLGGVNLQLVECDLSTNLKVKEMVDGDGEKGEGINSYSSTISQGYDVLFRPVLADRSVDGGK